MERENKYFKRRIGKQRQQQHQLVQQQEEQVYFQKLGIFRRYIHKDGILIQEHLTLDHLVQSQT